MNKRGKRDARDGSSSDSDVSSAIDEECALLSDYIDNDLSAEPRIPANLNDFRFGPSLLYVSALTERVPALFALLRSAPTLFADLSQAIDCAVSFLPRDIGFIILESLFADFVSVAVEVCDISLSQDQIDDVERLFVGPVILSIVIRRDCGFLDQTLVEQAVAAIDIDAGRFSLPDELQLAAGGSLFFQQQRDDNNIARLFSFPREAVDDIREAAQAALDEFLFVINDFCGIPLSSATLQRLDDYYLDDLVALPTGGAK